jgi:hypothetical protein
VKPLNWKKLRKNMNIKGSVKNAISLFGREFYQTRKPRGEGSGTGISNEGVLLARHTYDWDSFEERVPGRKIYHDRQVV